LLRERGTSTPLTFTLMVLVIGERVSLYWLEAPIRSVAI